MKKLKMVLPYTLIIWIFLGGNLIEGVFRASNIRRLQESDLNSPSASMMSAPATPLPGGGPSQLLQQNQLMSQNQQNSQLQGTTATTSTHLGQISTPMQQNNLISTPQVLQQPQTPIMQQLPNPQMPTPQIQTPQIIQNQIYQQNLAKAAQRLPVTTSTPGHSNVQMPLQSQSFVQQPSMMLNTPSSPYPQSTIYPTNQNPVAAGISSLANHQMPQMSAPQTPGSYMNRYPPPNPAGVTNEAFAMLHTMVNQSSRRQDGRCSLSGPDWPMSGSSVWTLPVYNIVYDNLDHMKLPIDPMSLIQFTMNF